MNYQGFIWAGLRVENLEASIAFYRDVLGLTLLAHGDDWAHLEAGNSALFELLSGGKAAHAPKTAEQQPLVLGLRVENLDQTVAQLKQKGVNFISPIGEYENTRWAHFADPEGNRLEIKEVPN